MTWRLWWGDIHQRSRNSNNRTEPYITRIAWSSIRIFGLRFAPHSRQYAIKTSLFQYQYIPCIVEVVTRYRQRQSKLSWLNMQTFRLQYPYRHDTVPCLKNSFSFCVVRIRDTVEVVFFSRLIKYRVSSPLTTSNTEIIKKRISWFMFVCVAYVSSAKISHT